MKLKLIKNLLPICFSFFLIFVLNSCKKDDSPQINVNSAIHKTSTRSLKINSLAASDLSLVTSSSFYLEKALPSGYVKDGSRDYTDVIQGVLLTYNNIVFPGFPILINEKGLDIPSNRTITFLEGSEIRLKPTSSDGYGMLKMRNASNVTLVEPVLKGDRFQHLGTTGEFGMGIAIYGGSYITILKPQCREMWGDGIYVGVENGVISKNITIKNATLLYNRRDGFTAAAVDGLLLESPYVAFSNGTKPMAGIAFEPNNKSQEVKNVIINNPRTQECGTGMFIDVGNLMGGGQKKVSVTVNNHIDIKSTIGMKAYSRIQDGSGSTIQGDFKIVNPKWSGNSTKAIQTILYGINDVHLIIQDPIVVNTSNYQLAKTETISYLTYKLNINQTAWRDITFSANWPTITSTTTSSPISPLYAINVGGAAYTSSNGIAYKADQSYSGGSTYQTTNTIANTTDDPLYQNERNGNFSYSLPVANGIYEITLKFCEVYQTSIGKRIFDTSIEGVEQISNIDVYANAGQFTAFDVVKSVQVSDGNLNMNFISNINNAQLCAFYVVKK